MKLVSSPYVFKKPLYLGHTPLNPNTHAQKSRRGDLSMHATNSYNTVWIIEAVNPNFRFEMHGQPINSHEPILIRNAATNHYVGSDSTTIK